MPEGYRKTTSFSNYFTSKALVDKEQGKSVDELRFEAQVQHDLASVLQRQADAGSPVVQW